MYFLEDKRNENLSFPGEKGVGGKGSIWCKWQNSSIWRKMRSLENLHEPPWTGRLPNTERLFWWDWWWYYQMSQIYVSIDTWYNGMCQYSEIYLSEGISSEWPMNNVTTSCMSRWATQRARLMTCNVTVWKVLDTVSDSTLQLTFKKLPPILVEYQSIHDYEGLLIYSSLIQLLICIRLDFPHPPKTTYPNRWNIRANMKTQVPSNEPDLRDLKNNVILPLVILVLENVIGLHKNVILVNI